MYFNVLMLCLLLILQTIGNLSNDNLKKNVSSTEKRLSQATVS